MTFTVLVKSGIATNIYKQLFNAPTRKIIDTPMLDYVEEAYAYHLLGVREHRFDDIAFESGSWSDLAKVNDDTSCSVANEDARVAVITWNIGDKNIVMTFPIQYDVLDGGTRSQIEGKFIAGLKSFKPTRRRLPDFSVADLKRMDENIMCLIGGTYMNPEINRNTYLMPGSDGEVQFVFSNAYPLAALANLMIVGNMEFQPMVNLSVSRHEYGVLDKKNLAYDNALQMLVESVNECRADDGKMPVSKSDVTVLVQQLQYDRGGSMLMFVYMEFDKAMSLTPKNNGNVSNAADKSSEISVDAHGTTPVSSGDKTADKVQNNISTNRTLLYVIENILEREMVDEVYLYLETKLDEGKLSIMEKARSIDSIPDDAYLVIYNKKLSVAALLSPVAGGQRTNLHSNTADELRNYSGCGVLWFK